ncbi:hypothetical protein ABIS04_03165 [Shewanella sp. H8]|uniref:hypothetical protein n=1 Tax=Shewanella sp. H8 TaxID=3342676 RepID=UPI003314EE8A
MEIITTFRDVQHTRILTSNPDGAHFIKPIMIAFIIHAVLILAIAWFWYQDTSQRKANFISSPKSEMIKSYLITAKQYQSIRDKYEKLNNPSSIANHDSSVLVVPKIPSQVVTSQTTIKTVNKSIISNKNQLKPVKNVNKDKPHQLNNAELSTKLNAKPNIKKSISTSLSIQQASTKFIQQHNSDQLAVLIGSQKALQNKPAGTMSEMDPQLDFIVLSPKVDISQPHTFNHKLDPNRIVKQGDYCYRVVELPTQINPHGYGLGYAKFCGEDKQQKLLTELINNRINNIK